MKPIDEHQVGDIVTLMMTDAAVGMDTKLRCKCISTTLDPIEGTPNHDHPRFKMGDGTILKPGDYIIMEDH